MNHLELEHIWKSQDQKMERLLAINKDIAVNLSKQKLNRQIGKLYRPKWTAILIGIPYTFLLMVISTIAAVSGAYFVAVGFGNISLIMLIMLLIYFRQVRLINQVRNEEEVLSTQQKLSKLKISSYRSLHLAVFQLPFWAVCWISVDALKESPFVYGGINLLVFAVLSYIAYWIFRKLSPEIAESKIRDFFFSGSEWEPILRSTEILEQIKEYER